MLYCLCADGVAQDLHVTDDARMVIS